MRIAYIILLLISFNFSNAQDFSAIYKQNIEVSKEEVPANERDAVFSQRHQLLMNNVKEIAKQLEYELKVSGGVSTFKSKEFLAKNNQQHLLKLANIYSSGTFYNDLSSGENLWQTEVFGKEYLVDLSQTDWRISKETEVINGYHCNKAEAIRTSYNKGKPIKTKVVAWYANEIPVNFGPVGYSGLPGLIVKLDIKDRSFVLQEINEVENKDFWEPEGKDITLQAYYELFTTARDNFQ